MNPLCGNVPEPQFLVQVDRRFKLMVGLQVKPPRSRLPPNLDNRLKQFATDSFALELRVNRHFCHFEFVIADGNQCAATYESPAHLREEDLSSGVQDCACRIGKNFLVGLLNLEILADPAFIELAERRLVTESKRSNRDLSVRELRSTSIG